MRPRIPGGVRRATARALLTAALALVAGAAASAAAQPEIDADVLPIELRWGAADSLESQSFELRSSLGAELAAVPPGGRVRVLGFPVAPGELADLELARFDPYAAGARVMEFAGGVGRQIARTRRLHFLGREVGRSEVRIGLSVDPDGGGLKGTVSHPAGLSGIARTAGEPSVPDRRLFEIALSRAAARGAEIDISCDTPPGESPGAAAGRQPAARAARAVEGPTHEATIAFDTDGELVQHYGGATATNDAIGDLVVALNVIYERDLELRLLQGETVLNTNPGSDPYVATSTGSQLSEVGSWWAANQGAVSRVFVALLSGKSPSEFSGSGIAWLDSYCEHQSTGGSYSATQVLRGLDLDHVTNVRLIGHEVGHNAGSSHTHCYGSPVDECYKAQSGCYSGPVSCPDHTSEIPGIAPGKGTIMSYCHASAPNGAACGGNEPYFHPTVSAQIQGRIAANTGPSCVQEIPQDADLSIATSDSEDPVPAGAGLTYTVTVENLGPAPAEVVTVAETLPSGMTFESTSGCDNDPGGVPSCALGPLASGESRVFTVTVAVSPTAWGMKVNQVDVGAASPDPVAANDSDMENTLVETPTACATGPLALGAADSTGDASFLSETSIAAGSGFEAQGGGEVQLRAPAIALGDEFSTAAGADFRAVNDSLVDCP